MDGAKHKRPPGRIDAPLRGPFQEDQLHILRHCRNQVTSRYGLSRPRKNPQPPAVNGQLDARHPPRLIAREVHRAHMATASFTPVGNCPDSPELLLRPSPATGHDAEMRGV